MKAVDVMIRERHEIGCYGTTLENFRKSCSLTDFTKASDLLILSCSLQSDCQELIERLPGDSSTGRETLRHWLNLSKWLVIEAARFGRM